MTLVTGSLLVHLGLLALFLAPPPLVATTQASGQVMAVRLLASSVVDSPAVVTQSPPSAPGKNMPSAAIPAWPTYLPSTGMDRRPTPVSAPDLESLTVAPMSGLPVRLRLYVDRSGRVVEVGRLEVSALDEDFAAAVAAMFRATAFLPGRRDGIDLPTFMDIELQAPSN